MSSNSTSSVTGVSPGRPRFARLRRWILGLAVVVTLAALFYAVEDWRGRAAWEQCKREMEAEGLELDWAKYVPTEPVPDAENFFKAPKMQEWFVKKDPNNFTNQIAWQVPFVGGSNPVVVAEVSILLPGTATDTGKPAEVLQLDDPETARQTEKLALDAIGPQVTGAQGYSFVAHPAEEIKPARIFLRAEKMPSQEELAALFPERALGLQYFVPGATSALKVQAAGNNLYRVVLDPPPESAAAYVAATDKMKADFDLLREALKRPYARMEGDYAAPITMPGPNYVEMRFVAQLFSERAQCHLMLGQPEEALQDLAVIDGLCRMLECRPSGPRTLVGPMINVAIRGLHAQTVGDGLRMGAWREPQLMALQQQLQEVNLLQQVDTGFREAGAAFCINLETLSAKQYAKAVGSKEGEGGAWFLALAPRGWRYQNMVRVARAHRMVTEEFDLARGMALPGKAEEVTAYLRTLSSFSPYSYFTLRYIPNYTRAGMVMAYQQTMANEALIACALARYRAAQGQYPETLDALAPQYLGKIPKDIIGGGPLIYHRTDNGKFMLYGVGWNEKDDGGTPGRNNGATIEYENGDWVWLNCR